MGKLVGLLSSGIGLAIEAASEYQSSSKSVGKRTNSHYQQDLTYEPRDIYHDENQAQRDTKAFQELQRYADFQKVLSNRVQDDIFRDEKYTPIDPQILGQGPSGDYFSHQPYIHPSLQPPSPRGLLPCPVIIPQRRPEDKSRGWVRAYAPVLMDCGIEEYIFLNFLDAFNESSKSSPYLDAVNVAGLGVGFAPGITPMIISMAVPVAVRMAKTAQTEKKSTDFLTRANNELFAPHGLFAMVMTYKPTSISQTPTVDMYQPFQPSAYANESRANSPELPTSAPLIFPDPEPTGSAGQQNKFKQIGHFIADYGDRRAQARYAFEHPESSLATPPPTFRSRWGDPNNPANSGGLVSLISGRPRERDHKRGERKERRRRGSGGGGKESPGLIGSMRGTVNGPGKEDQGLIKGLRGIGMKKDVLYLLIVNAPTSTNSSPPSINATPLLIPQEQTSNPYRSTKRIKSPPRILEPDPFQQPWTPESGVGWLPNDRYGRPMAYNITPENRGQSPPPAYSSPQKLARYERAEREYCVPTL